MLVEDYNENYTNGWVKIFRSIRNHWLWEDERKLKWWFDILLEVNHKDNSTPIRMSLFECHRGQSVKSLRTWAKRWRVSTKTVSRFFKMLESDKMLKVENIKMSTRITVCNYESYQKKVNATETVRKQQGNTTETEQGYKQECKELNNDNNEISKQSDSKSNDTQFELFWNYYDHKTGKKAARSAWNKLSNKKIESIREHLPKYLKCTYVTGKDKPFDEARIRMNPATYLNGERWNDEPLKKPSEEKQVYVPDSKMSSSHKFPDRHQRTGPIKLGQ